MEIKAWGTKAKSQSYPGTLGLAAKGPPCYWWWLYGVKLNFYDLT